MLLLLCGDLSVQREAHTQLISSVGLSSSLSCCDPSRLLNQHDAVYIRPVVIHSNHR